MKQPGKRIRRSKEEAKSLILDAAEHLLIEGGTTAVQVRAVANTIGITDAAINHHFENRDGLLEAMLRRAGKRLKTQISEVVIQWEETEFDLDTLIELFQNLYAKQGYATLALQLHLSGWRDKGSGLLTPIVESIHKENICRARESGQAAPSLDETRFAVGALHQLVALNPIFGNEFARSAGASDKNKLSAAKKKEMWADLARRILLTSKTE
ncbi:MAG: TetR family transcriptional regulator [Rhodobiaceae bacterium]|nr:TetR family transcriptional regulator [Rhodobiaceae bacterium]